VSAMGGTTMAAQDISACTARATTAGGLSSDTSDVEGDVTEISCSTTVWESSVALVALGDEKEAVRRRRNLEPSGLCNFSLIQLRTDVL
jgi:hypothetical protein